MQFATFVLLTLLAVSGTAFKILFYIPCFGISHVNFSGRLADIIAQAGHEVAIYQPIMDDNIKSKGFKSPNITKYFTLSATDYGFSFSDFEKGIWSRDVMNIMKSSPEARGKFCEAIMNDAANLADLKAENFDLVVTEWFEPCGFAVIEAIGAKKFVITTSGNLLSSQLAIFGIKPHHSYTPAALSSMTEKMDF